MCNPVAAVMVGGVALNALQGQDAAQRENAYEMMLYGERKEAALANIAQINAREQQERAAAAMDIQRVTRQARQAAGAAKLQALEGGVRGRSVDLLLQTFEADRLNAVGAVEQNLGFTSQQLAAERKGAARITPAQRHYGPFDSPLGILSTGFSLFGAGLPTPKTPAA